ncbi:MAG: 16S rRNA (cytidine(1402)-2'-O)-methyltransferase [Candidatus Eremiobacteraeota bacterium]|nr:16S rRNA (cytidine(1402)-2'-O)-methyltransferase [Candidatus Eremiobacteraeota bacterium]
MPLTFVPTPLGNLRDITLRALDVLRECDVLVAEDTRVARKLLSALKLPSKPLLSYREQNAALVTGQIIDAARAQNVAVVSDAGTPAISDPGTELIAAARASGVAVELLPGPSAVLGAAALSGFNVNEFTFAGFLPRKSGARRAAFEALANGASTTVWFESPQRIRAALRDLEAVDARRRCFILREYTKLHEQQIAGTAGEVAAALPEPVRGEIVLVVEGGSKKTTQPIDFELAADALFAKRESVAAVAKTLAQRGYGPRREIYTRLLQRRQSERRKR